MKINYNVSAMIANAALQKNDKSVATSLERLSSGLKINHAKDNASGLAMAKRMNAQIRSIETANQNSNDGVSVIEIAEGALQEVEDMVQRMNELAVKACNGTLSDEDREYINNEIDELKKEIGRISGATMYNGQVLLDGSFDAKGYTSDINLKVTTYSNDVRSGKYSISNLSLYFDDEKMLVTPEMAAEDPSLTACSITLGPEFPDGCKTTFFDDKIMVEGDGGFSMEFRITDLTDRTYSDVDIDITGLGSMKMQIGSNEGQELDVRIMAISTRTLGIEKLDCRTYENSHKFLEQMSESIKYINEARSKLGAYQNRLEHTISTLDISEENMTGAYSRIMDVDMAEEMTEYTKNNVLVQAGTSMLAQANERPSSVLQLLQG